MKKVLSAAIALGLVAGVSANASAAFDSFSVSGYYTVSGIYADNATAGVGANIGVDNASASWWEQEFRMFPILTVNDKITMKAEVRIIDDVMFSGADVPTQEVADFDKLYMEYKSPVGKIRMGRIPWGGFGPAFVSSSVRNDGFIWWPSFVAKPLVGMVVIAKSDENDAMLVADDDADVDYYDVRLGYKTDAIDSLLSLAFNDNGSVDDMDWYRLRGYAKGNMGSLYLEGEFDYRFGDNGANSDKDELAMYIHGRMNSGNLTMGALAWYLSGNDVNSVDDEGYGQAGNDFNPLLIATGDDFGLLNGETNTNSTLVTALGQLAIGAYVAMPVNDKLTLTGVIGAAWADEEENAGAGADDFYGWEIDVKADYKLLDNLTYSVNLGYFAADDLMTANDTTPEDNVLLLAHTLNMTF